MSINYSIREHWPRCSVIAAAALAMASYGCASGSPGKPGDSDVDAVVIHPPPPAADAPPRGVDAMPNFEECDVLEQSGCKSGLACDLDLEHLDVGGTTCRGVKNPGTEQASCTAQTDCAGGYSCFSTQCYEYCQSNADCQEPGGICFFTVTTGGEAVPGAPKLCSKDCAPEKATGNRCPDGFSCHLYSQTDGPDFTDCDPPPDSGGGEGAKCDSGQAACKPGLGCFVITRTDSNGNKTMTDECRVLCRPGKGDCPTGQTCQDALYTIGSQGYSACLPT
ncbi:MAG TPA: hypothetical protein VFG83_06300 [Kofleriaceae bacterium]|nr:hypothetical protein [Kofleriaceae bacterium]